MKIKNHLLLMKAYLSEQTQRTGAVRPVFSRRESRNADMPVPPVKGTGASGMGNFYRLI